MKGRIGILSVLLAVQLAIAAALIFVRAGAAGESPDRLLALDAANVDRIVLTDGESGEVTLERGETGWTTADGLPADDTKVSELIETFGSMDAPWPVASTQGARERFEVDDDRFQRRVRFYQGDAVAGEVFLGTSPGYRRVHARAADSDDVYAIEYAVHQVPTNPDDWMDAALLAIDGDVLGVDRAGVWTLERASADAPWTLRAGDEARVVDETAAETLAKRFSDLRVLGRVEDPGESRGTFVVTNDAGEETSYEFFHAEEGDTFSVSVSNRNGHFEVAGYIAEQILVDEGALEAAQDGSVAGDEATDTDTVSQEAVESALEAVLEGG